MKVLQRILLFSTFFACFLLPSVLKGQALEKAKKGKKNPIFLHVVPQMQGKGWKIHALFEHDLLFGQEKADGFEATYALYSANDTLLAQENLDLTSIAYRYDDCMSFSFDLMPNFEAQKLLVTVRLRPLPQEKKLEAQQAIWLPANQADASHWYNETYRNLSFTRLGDTARFIGTSTVLHVYHFPQFFHPADPPMQLQSSYPSPYMKEKSVTRVLARSPFIPTEKGIYFIQKDTNTNVGTSILVTDSDYPKFKKLAYLADAMIYVATMDEIERMKGAPDVKEALDDFWMKLGGNEVNAQRLVKMYYQRAAHANRYFFSFKEGWKTDRGMIYIVFGRPSEIEQDGQTERWIYHRRPSGQSKVIFEFDRKPSLFSPNHYVLRRSHEFTVPWYTKVEQWRTGKLIDLE